MELGNSQIRNRNSNDVRSEFLWSESQLKLYKGGINCMLLYEPSHSVKRGGGGGGGGGGVHLFKQKVSEQ